MTEQQNDPAAYLERAARLLGVPLSSDCLPSVIADPENFRALFQTVDMPRDISGKANPLDAFRPR
jgi:hypothetical protein